MPTPPKAHWPSTVKRKLIYALAALGLGAAAAWSVIWRTPPPGPPADRPITIANTAPLKVVAFGTSLTGRYDWPERLQAVLAQCLDQPVIVTKIAKPGQPVTWGETQIGSVLAEKPDLVLMEFSINDADIRDGVPFKDSIAAHERILRKLSQADHAPQIVLMTMSPAHGPRGLIRPRLWAYYQSYHDLAARYRTGLVDAYPRWLALPGWKDRFADGLHPEPEPVNQVLLPAILDALGCGTG